MLVSSVVPCSPSARFPAAKVIGRTLASTVLQLLYLPILSPNEDFLFSVRWPETDKNYLILAWPIFLQNGNHKGSHSLDIKSFSCLLFFNFNIIYWSIVD